MASLSISDRLALLRSPLERMKAADPLLMAAAIAYNAFFALVPLAFAAAAALATLGQSEEGLARVNAFLSRVFPPDMAQFLTELFEEATAVVGTWQGPVFVISLLVAVYSGSRAIYAVQRALRQIQRAPEDRPFWQVRGLGVLFTFGAGVALVAGYVIVLFSRHFASILEEYGLSFGSITGFSGVVLAAWVALVLFAIYRWGPPSPMERSVVSAVVATAGVGLSTWVAAFFIPAYGGGTLALLGATGVVLLWLYIVGMVVIVVPALVAPTEAVIRGTEA